MDKIVFLDRDGVINEDSPEYIKRPEEFLFIEKSPEAIALLNRFGWEVIVITNQSMIGRNISTLEELFAIFRKMNQGVEKAGGKIRDIFFCPHAPDQGCACRKPLPGMILAAAGMYDIDLASSCMVGDSAKDILTGKHAGCGNTGLVLTGNGKTALAELGSGNHAPDHVAENLWDMACRITGEAKL